MTHADRDNAQQRQRLDVETLALAYYVVYLLPPWPDQRGTQPKAEKGASGDDRRGTA